ncbi:MAG: septum formation initiator family protein [Planctomycetes bacterium]|jgi:hypothetical protein|nr:septum formation initiator family protein [Planctomycetota bacterium]HON44080.1 septum formation initiator family protein [Planctomycetota bacterium]HPY75737.1 septum formation initiator family protein [Planctomycetota bacterium]HQB01329.1 septum formation initiator family protein [Planctomycetota bacterium]HRU52280.1 septum formation initiator family protein [Planctomycetota bacterium]
MNQNFGKNIYLYSGFLCIFILIVIVNSLLPLWKQNQMLKENIQVLQEKNKELTKKKLEYQKKIYAIKNNPVYMEYVIRKELNYGRKGEMDDRE